MRQNERLFESLVQPHFDALYRAAYRLTRQREDAEDLVQEVCARASAELGKLSSLDFVLGWLLRVQYRVFVDSRRRLRRSPIGLFGESGADEGAAQSPLPGPESQADAEMQFAQLSVAWKLLTAEQRALLALHAEGYGLPELEQITGKSRNVLSARLHRARRRLAKLLQTDFEPNQLSVTVSKNGL